jgi:hypothetical protein
MSRSIESWERLRPSQGQNGAPGRRLLSHDGESLQVGVYRKKHGQWAGATIYTEWVEETEALPRRWRFHMLDAHDRHYPVVSCDGFETTKNAFRESIEAMGLPTPY